MLIDHIGMVFFDDIIIFRIIGRIAFPIFAYLVAEGYSKTHNKKKYFLRMLIFAILSTVPFLLVQDGLILNIMFTFTFAIIVMYLYDNVEKAKVKLASAEINQKSFNQADLFLNSALFYCALFTIVVFTVIVPTDYYFYGVFICLEVIF